MAQKWYDRRTVLRCAGAVSVGALAGCFHEDDADMTVTVGADGEPRFDPQELLVDVGALVEFVWEDDGHNIDVRRQSSQASTFGEWEGEEEIQEEGHSIEYEFLGLGTYEYVCEPHENDGMWGRVVTVEDSEEVETVTVGADGDLAFEPETVEIEENDVVEFIWEDSGHNINVVEQPEDAEWDGISEIQEEGYTHLHWFGEVGEYEYVCEPHEDQGMSGTIIVEEEEEEEE